MILQTCLLAMVFLALIALPAFLAARYMRSSDAPDALRARATDPARHAAGQPANA